MARDPGSVWAPLPESGRQGTGVKTKFIVHSTGTRASAAANRAYFARADVVVESTFIVGLDSRDPTLQLLDSAEVADANASANDEGISVEVVGTGDDDYTPWQVAELARLGRWAHAIHGIPLHLIPSAAQESGGYGWHVMFGAPGPWTSVVGKVCPGNVRVRRLLADVFPAIYRPTEADMNLDELYGARDKRGRNFIDFQNYVYDELMPAIEAVAGAVLFTPFASADGGQRNLIDFQVEQLRQITGGQDRPLAAQVDYGRIAATVADEVDRRARDGNPKTGPVS